MHSSAISHAAPDASAVSTATTSALERECQAFATYLLGVEPTPYQTAKYVDYHRRHRLEALGPFDVLLYRVASANRLGLELADAYSGTVFRTALLRSKLVLTLAILESSAPSFRRLDDPGPQLFGGATTILIRLAGAAIVLALAVPVLGPFHLWHAWRARRGAA